MTIERVWKLVDEKRNQLPDLRIFLVTHRKWLRVYRGKVEMYIPFEELAFIKNLKDNKLWAEISKEQEQESRILMAHLVNLSDY